MKISIVVPVFNAEKYLSECIESVLDQTNDNWELILVDDGSTDKSAEICDAFSNKYPEKIFVFHKKNEGQFLTRQFGIKKCSGDYIGFLDADDLLSNHYIHSILEAVKNNSNTDVICFNFSEFEGDIFKEKKQLEKKDFDAENIKLLYTMIINGTLTGSMWSKAFKKELITNIVIDEETVAKKRYGEDAFQSFAIMLNAKKVSFLDDVLYYYRSNPVGFSQGFAEKDFDYFNTVYVFSLIERFLLENYKDDVDLFEQLYARNFNETVYYILKFYRTAQSKDRRKCVVQYDWKTFLLESTLSNIQDNVYVNKTYIKVWKAFNKKAHLEITLREKFKKIIGW